MILFLTSSPTGPLDNSRDVDGFDDKNRFVENLRRHWPADARILMVSASPDDAEFNDIIRDDMARILRRRGFPFSALDMWDSRSGELPAERLLDYGVVFLCGGHVPTQNAFLHRIGLVGSMGRFPGVVIGISAGTMNCAETVYAQPEEPGESLDPNYRRFLEGLGLTRINVLPHYQMLKDSLLDGRRLFDDISCGDSMGRRFLALPDGSYVLSENGQETLYGEAWSIEDGRMEPVCRDGWTLALKY